MKMTNALLGLLWVVATGFWVGSAAGAVVWTESWEDNGTGVVPINTAFPVWFTDAANPVRLANESFAIRPAGMTGTTRCTQGPSVGNWCGARHLGKWYTSGTLSIDGWLDARSSDSAPGNYAGFGFGGWRVTGNAYPDLWVRYKWNDDEIALLVGDTVMTFGDAVGTSDPSPTYSNEDPVNYNQWQHVKLELDLYWKAARIYADTDRSTPGGPWVQVGDDVALYLYGQYWDMLYGITVNSRDGGTDDLTVDWVSTHGPAPILRVTLDGTVNPVGYTGDLAMVGVNIEFRQGGAVIQTVKTLLNSDGSFSIPNVKQGTYDVAVSGTGLLQKVVANAVVSDDPTNMGSVNLIGENDGDNAVTSTDLSIVLASMDQTGDP